MTELVSIVENDDSGLVSLDDNDDIFAYKNQLIKQHYGSSKDLISKIKSSKNGDAVQDVINVVIEEIIKESDNLLGNSLVFTKENKLHDATTVAVKRTDILETVTRIVTKQQEINQKSAKIDLNSPAFQIFQSICLDNLRTTLEQLKLENEMAQLIILKWGESMEFWEKEMKTRMGSLNEKE